MANTPMVILWKAPNGTTILSHRQASGHVEPQPVTHPPRLATVVANPVDPLPDNVSPILAFDISKTPELAESLIWAYGVTVPDPDPNTSIVQHLDAGRFSLDLANNLEVSSSPTVSSDAQSTPGSPTVTSISSLSASSQVSSTTTDEDRARTNSLLVAHAVFCAAGFLIMLPLGALVARWTRVFTAKWFTAHWFINVVLGLPLICIGWALGPLAVAQQGLEHVVTAHQIGGVVLFALFIVQVALGTLVHMRRPKDGRKAHPPRNILHVGLGLAIFGLSIYETINGADRDPGVSGTSQKAITAICITWAATFSGTYGIGLLFLRRQIAQERLGWNVPDAVPLPLPILAPRRRTRADSPEALAAAVPARRRGTLAALVAAADVDVDDGTHDVFSEAARLAGEDDGPEREREAAAAVADERPARPASAVVVARTVTEMREVLAVPVSLSAYL
ncbi:uncharacterized protein BXZ73DRAFT_95816 [Epithele typhae]|uniref:uncharacterized protein n=1 Tax=Epithele typhae TaxID=378194 RepID=UPI0020080099|nr:uncharacterized protein BXZ73DRAFT_95816 [Epithele typhae]KAH9946313.1 hypothetical protein BXZ73DRAFT_95816 [Epithele typhae]